MASCRVRRRSVNSSRVTSAFVVSTAAIEIPWRRHSWRKNRKYSSEIGVHGARTAARPYPFRFSQLAMSVGSSPTSPFPTRKQYSPWKASVPHMLTSGTFRALTVSASAMAESVYWPRRP